MYFDVGPRRSWQSVGVYDNESNVKKTDSQLNNHFS